MNLIVNGKLVRKKICIVATVPNAINMFMAPHIKMLAKEHEVTIISNAIELDFAEILNEHVKFIAVDFSRKISLWRDLVNLLQLYRIFRKKKFDVVHSIMPKTGLLSMLAAFISRVPIRLHTFTGQVWANKLGLQRFLLKNMDKIIADCATNLLTDGYPQKHFLLEQGVVNESKIRVLAKGSTRGVDIKRFKPNLIVRNNIRKKLGISESAIVFLFLGRLNKDKGILDLASAFSSVAKNMPNVYLILVGTDEEGISKSIKLILSECLNQYRRVDFTNKPEELLASADIFCLPSYREGFPSVILEAAAVGMPSIATNIYGVTDAVVDGVTGILHKPGNIDELKTALLTLANDFTLREKMSKAATERVRKYFLTDILVNEMSIYYKNLFANSN